MDLVKPDNKSKSYPWENASNYKSPVAAEAIRDFGDRYCTQILGKAKLIAGSIEGDKDAEKDATAKRVTVKAVITSIDDSNHRIVADGFLCVDDRPIYRMIDFALEVRP